MTQRNDGITRVAGTRSPRADAIRRMLCTAPFAVAFWLLLSGHYEPLLLTLGALSVVVVCWLAWRAGVDQLGAMIPLLPRLPWYALWLGGQVLSSAVAVARKVWSPRPALRPVVAPTPASDLPELEQVIYANSITLTPGTLSLDVGDDRIEVHSLEQAGVDELREGSMLGRVRGTGARR